MNICIFVDSRLDAPGGVTQSICNQKSILERAGHTVYIVCLGQRVIDDPAVYYARPYVMFVTPDVDFSYLVPNPWTARRVRRWVAEKQIDVIHVQSESSTAELGCTIGRQLGLPVLATVHNYFWPATGPLQTTGGVMIEAQVLLFAKERLRLSPYGNNRLERAMRGLTERMSQQVDGVLAPSAHLRDALRGAGVTTPIDVVPNPYVTPIDYPAPQLVERQAPVRFVWVGRCAAEKRLFEFIEAVRLARQRTTRPFHVTIVGGGPDLAEARRVVQRAALSDVIEFTGRLPNSEVIAYIDAASMVVLTSYRFDNQPVVVSEAISRYRGVLYCDDRMHEGVDQAGLLAPAPDADGLARAMTAVVDDPEIASTYSRKAKRASKQFTGAVYTARLTDIITRVAGNKTMVQ